MSKPKIENISSLEDEMEDWDITLTDNLEDEDYFYDDDSIE